MNTQSQHAFDRAATLHQQGDLTGARSVYSEILKQDPLHVAALQNLASICFATEEYELAENLYSVVLKIKPDTAEAYFNRGCCRQCANDPASAEADYRTCLDINSEHIAALENLIAVTTDRNAPLGERMELVERRLHIAGDTNYLLILAQLKTLRGDLPGADQCYREVHKQSPANPVAGYHLATQRLRRANWQDGTNGLDNRWHIDGFVQRNLPKSIPLPKWSGETLEGKKIFVAAEQGVGDGVMFASHINDLSHAAEVVVLEADPRMIEIYRRSFPAIGVIGSDDSATTIPDLNWQQFDCYCNAGDMIAMDASAGGHRAPAWLAAAPDLSRQWDSWLAHHRGLKIGISWQGGSDAEELEKHSLTLEQFVSMFDGIDATLVSIQYDPDEPAIADINRNRRNPILIPDIDVRNDLDSVFALIHCLDLVVTIDNCNAYFAAALGTPTWVLLPLACDWRWQGTDEISQWRGNVRAFNNQSATSWTDLISAVAAALGEYGKKARNKVSPDIEKTTAAKSSVVISSSCARTHHQKVLLFNDTLNWQHWGYSCASLPLHQRLAARGYRVSSFPAFAAQRIASPGGFDQFDDSQVLSRFINMNSELCAALQSNDLLLLNAEGVPQHSAMLFLYLAYIARQAFGMRVQLFNQTFLSPDLGPLEDAQLSLLAHICRNFDTVISGNERALTFCKTLNVDGELGFSGLPLTIRDAFKDVPAKERVISLGSPDQPIDSPYIEHLAQVIGRKALRHYRFEISLGARAFMSGNDIALAEALTARGINNLETHFCVSESEWLSRIAGAELMIGGSFHHTLAAACLGTPFVSMPGSCDPLEDLFPSPPEPIDSPFDEIQLLTQTDACQIAQLHQRATAGLSTI